jgi:SET domain-containing protein
MYKVPVEVRESAIDGKGVFATADISKEARVWVFKDGYDLALTPQEYDALPPEQSSKLDPTAYLSPWTGLWVFPPEGDPAQFTNHSDKNNLTAKYDKDISSEPYFIANRNIAAGEELTNNYHEFDEITRATKPAWAK